MSAFSLKQKRQHLVLDEAVGIAVKEPMQQFTYCSRFDQLPTVDFLQRPLSITLEAQCSSTRRKLAAGAHPKTNFRVSAGAPEFGQYQTLISINLCNASDDNDAIPNFNKQR